MMSTVLILVLLSAVTAEATDLLETFRQEFVAITPGKGKFPKTFQVGTVAGGKHALAARTVALAEDFHVGKYEVTQNLWTAVMGENPSRWGGDRNSVEMLSYGQAIDFCKRVTKRLQITGLISKNQEVRLPTEIEWEYVARAGTNTLYSFGDDAGQLDDYAWSTQNAAGNDPPVGTKKPNPWGLYDIHGYLWEWCLSQDEIDTEDKATSTEISTGSSPASVPSTKRAVLRGGSWKDKADQLTSRYRTVVSRELRDAAVGLRCVLVTRTKEK